MAKNMDSEMREDDLEETGSEMRVYELGFHIDPELPVEEAKKTYQTIRDAIAEKSTVVAEGEPEKVQLAYTISRGETAGRRDFDSSYFSWIAYETPVSNHGEIIGLASSEKRIIRFVDLITTKDAARHAVELHELAMKAPEQTEEPEAAAAGAELDAALEGVTI